MHALPYPKGELELANPQAYERLIEAMQNLRDEIGELAVTIRVMEERQGTMAEQLKAINGKVQQHQSWIDGRQAQLTMLVGLFTLGAAIGGLITGVVAHFVK